MTKDSNWKKHYPDKVLHLLRSRKGKIYTRKQILANFPGMPETSLKGILEELWLYGEIWKYLPGKYVWYGDGPRGGFDDLPYGTIPAEKHSEKLVYAYLRKQKGEQHYDKIAKTLGIDIMEVNKACLFLVSVHLVEWARRGTYRARIRKNDDSIATLGEVMPSLADAIVPIYPKPNTITAQEIVESRAWSVAEILGEDTPDNKPFVVGKEEVLRSVCVTKPEGLALVFEKCLGINAMGEKIWMPFDPETATKEELIALIKGCL